MSVRILEPKELWNHFADLNNVPRPSKKEDRVIEFMMNFGKKLGLETKTDKIGNDGTGYRTKATYINVGRPDTRIDEFIKIRPFRRIEQSDIDKIWPEWPEWPEWNNMDS